MLNLKNLTVIAGAELLAQLQIEKDQKVAKSKFVEGCYASDSLVPWQQEISRRGILGAEIVKTIYGYSLRYDSGLQNFGIITGRIGTLEQAENIAREWIAREPAKRYAWIRKGI